MVTRISLFTVSALVALSACAPNKGATPVKDINSVWTATDGSKLDLSAGGTAGILFAQTGGNCRANFLFQGTPSGLFHIYNSHWEGSGSDPGCASFNQDRSYAKGDTTLVLCDPVKCTLYQ